MKIVFSLLLFIVSSIAFAEDRLNIADVQVQCDKCLTNDEYNQVVSQLQDLIKQNSALIDKVKQLQDIQSATPSMQLDPLVITIDDNGRVFVLDKLNGKLQIGTLSYDVSVKVDSTIVKAKQKEYGFNLKFKAAVLQNYERSDDGELKSYTSGALAIEPFYYRSYNLNLVVGPRLYGPAIGVDITEHFDALVGIGFLYNDTKTFFFGAAFDF